MIQYVMLPPRDPPFFPQLTAPLHKPHRTRRRLRTYRRHRKRIPRPHLNLIILWQTPLYSQEPLVIIKSHSTLTALRYKAHMKILRDITLIIKQHRFVALETAGAGDPLVR